MSLAMRAAAAFDALSIWTGRMVAWGSGLLVAIVFSTVVLRYFFDVGWIWMQELGTWLHGMLFLLGAAYTLRREEHVRVDIFYRTASARRRAWVDALGVVFLLAPVCVFLLWVGLPYALEAWLRTEGSRETGGLPFPFVPLAKSAIPAMALLLLLQGTAMMLRAVLFLRGAIDEQTAGYAATAPGADW